LRLSWGCISGISFYQASELAPKRKMALPAPGLSRTFNPQSCEVTMLFNKKPEGELMGDLSAIRRPSTGVAGATEPSIPAVRNTNGVPTRSVIDAWLQITGNLQSEGEVQVDGQIHGDIRCAHLTVGRDARVAGNITAEEVVVRGKVTGLIRAIRVILQDTAQVDSEIVHKKLSIEEGATFEGVARRSEDPLSAETPSANPMRNGNGNYHTAEAVA
jgi:cytoskeletal protein CcmA (bactofilin family)